MLNRKLDDNKEAKVPFSVSLIPSTVVRLRGLLGCSFSAFVQNCIDQALIENEKVQLKIFHEKNLNDEQ